jgi:hypothetical protein
MHPQTPHRSRILLATTQDAEPVLRRALAPLEADLAVEHECGAALRAIAAGVDLVVCTMRFDESRMLDFAARLGHDWPRLPFVCCRVLSNLPGPAVEAAFVAAENLGAVEMVNLRVAPLGEERLRRAVLAHLHDMGHASMS